MNEFLDEFFRRGFSRQLLDLFLSGVVPGKNNVHGNDDGADSVAPPQFFGVQRQQKRHGRHAVAQGVVPVILSDGWIFNVFAGGVVKVRKKKGEREEGKFIIVLTNNRTIQCIFFQSCAKNEQNRCSVLNIADATNQERNTSTALQLL